MRRAKPGDLEAPGRKRLYNERLFTEVAPRYDVITRLLSFGRDGAWKRRLLRLLPETASADCLDLACGTGDLTAMLASRYPTGDIVGVDLNPHMLQRARRRSELRRSGVRLIRASMDSLPFAAGSFDVVTGGYAVRNAPDLSDAFAEIERVLRPGGTVAFLEFSRAPAGPLWGFQYRLLRFWGALWGLLLHGSPEVYAYIARSLAAFPDRRELETALGRAGFVRVRSRALMVGFLALTTCRKA